MRRDRLLYFGVIVFIMVIFVFVGLASAQWKSERKFLIISTGSVGGTWPILGAMIADIITKEVPGVTASTVLGGGRKNMVAIEQDKAQLAFSTAAGAFKAYRGKEPFEAPLTKIRHVMSHYGLYAQFVTPRKGDLKSWDQLTKKPYRVNILYEGSTTQATILAIMQSYGIGLDDITKAGGSVSRVGYSDGMTMMKDGLIDVTGVVGPSGHNVILQLDQNVGIRILPVGREQAKIVGEILPGYVPATISKEAYRTTQEDCPTVVVYSSFYCSADLSEELVYRITKAIFENLEKIHDLFPAAKEILLKNALQGAVVPVHPGAKRFYEEKGLKVPEIK